MNRIIIQHALTAAKISSRLEPSGLHRADGKRPYGMTIVPWSRECIWCGMPHVSTLFASYTVEEQPQSQEELLHMRKKTRQEVCIPGPHVVAVETCGTIGKHLRTVTGELRSYAFLMQRISVATQTVNATSVIAFLPVNATTSISFEL